MRSVSLIVLFFTIWCSAGADTLTVNIDGTAQYISIQTAVGNSSSGDVIIVFPGTYTETVDLYYRDDLTLTSLYYAIPEDSIIESTIIDGNFSGSCISIKSGEQNFTVSGFTIMN